MEKTDFYFENIGINGFSICVYFSFFFFVIFRSLVIFDLTNLNLAQHVYSSPS